MVFEEEFLLESAIWAGSLAVSGIENGYHLKRNRKASEEIAYFREKIFHNKNHSKIKNQYATWHSEAQRDLDAVSKSFDWKDALLIAAAIGFAFVGGAWGIIIAIFFAGGEAAKKARDDVKTMDLLEKYFKLEKPLDEDNTVDKPTRTKLKKKSIKEKVKEIIEQLKFWKK